MERWYLASHKPGRGNAFKSQLFLSQLGISVFIPQICKMQPRTDRPGHARKVVEPLFPGYIFIFFDYEQQQISKVECCPGVNKLVRFGGILRPLNDNIVDEILMLTTTIGHEPPECHDKKINISYGNNNACKALIKKQCQQIRAIANELDGEKRSSLFYAFMDALDNNH
ncbi:transcription termination/antitermination NusG family protein [Aeromonas sp. SG16]|uniref:transcription termination/antitermination NusG family protein n=1 Tax=Aeromonas sp. SG16 TaxID=2950548 RepID=UPI00210BE131|nr:transcription termination/antitermination NusG family protein [Aeromonas sp. SG16]MCQ4054434.1 hypothetical protein [Aeromonas sp. SG16]